MLKLKNKEGLNLTAFFDNYPVSCIYLHIGNILYAVITNFENNEDLDWEKITNWVEETYYTKDYKCPHYIPCDLNGQEFLKEITNKTELKEDWLNWFKLTVQLAADYRLKGDICRAMALDYTVNEYYKEAKKYNYYDEDVLFEMESDIRAGGINGYI